MSLIKMENNDKSDIRWHVHNALMLLLIAVNLGVFRVVYQDFSALHEELHNELQVLNNTRKSNPRVLFFNRVSKTGSTSMLEAIKSLQEANSFQMLPYKLSRQGFDTETRTMGPLEQIEVAHDMSSDAPLPLAYYRHFHFINFETINQTNPIYFNMVRHPIARLESWFYFVRQSTFANADGSDGVPLRRLKVTLDECIIKNIPGCGIQLNDTTKDFITEIMKSSNKDQKTRRSKYSKLSVARMIVENLDPTNRNESDFEARDMVASQVQYFCGYSPECFSHPKVALRKAIHNVDNYYSVVGVLEELETTYEVLEKFIPYFFQGIRALAKGVSNKTFHKPKLSHQARAILADFLNTEIIFYDFCVQRLQKQYKALYFKR